MQLKNIKVICVIIVPLFFFANKVNAEVIEKFRYASYKAIANPNRPLYESLNNASTIRQNGEVYHGYTEWSVLWQYHFSQDNAGQCKITKVVTHLDTVVTLPTLAGGTAKQQSTFLRYYNALKEHELGHYYYGKTAATEIDQKILQLPRMENCKALESTANKLGDDIIEFYKRKDSQYDATTQHGKSQGAWLEE